MEEGWVYVLVNSSVPGLVKVGRTSRSPAQRAAELSAVTGVPTPFVVAFEHHFDDCHAAERGIHAELDRRGLRVAANREFFRGPPSEIIRVVLSVEGIAGAATQMPDPATAAALLAAGDRAFYGQGDALQDSGEAARCYRLAAARGCPVALERLGAIYAEIYARQRDRAARRRAMAPLKEGVRRGNPYCYVEMARLFAAEGHMDNVAKAWALFFAAQKSAGHTPAGLGERESTRFVAACCRYICMCLDLRLPPGHETELRAVADEVMAALLGDLDRVRNDPRLRMKVSGALRWTHAMLSPKPVAASREKAAWTRWRGWFAAPDAAAVA